MMRWLVAGAMLCVNISSIAFAAENPAEAYRKFASELFSSIGKDVSLAVQPLSEEEANVPSQIIQSIEVGFFGALQTGSDFEAKLFSRDRTLVLWQESLANPSRPFEQIVFESGAKFVLVGKVERVSNGLQVAYTAYRLENGKRAGAVASLAPKVLALDVPRLPERALGNEAMREMIADIKRLSNSGGLVSSPKNPADFYHNARILSQRGEIDLAVASYEKLLDFPITFIDPIEDLVALAKRVYGSEGAVVFLEKRLKNRVTADQFIFASLLVGNRSSEDVETLILEGKVKFLPIMAAYLITTNAKEKIAARDNVSYATRKVVLLSTEAIKKAYGTGEFQSLYIDSIRAERDARSIIAIQDVKVQNTVNIFYDVDKAALKKGVGTKTPRMPDTLVLFDRNIDPSKPFRICYVDDSRKRTCADLMQIAKSKDFDGLYAAIYGINTPKSTRPFQCVVQLSWTDRKGFNHIAEAEEVNAIFDPNGPFRQLHLIKDLEDAGVQNFYRNCVASSKDEPIASSVPVSEGKLTIAPQVEKRVALVIGNSKYRYASSLTNAVRDAAAISTALKTLGFDTVQLVSDLNREQLMQTLRQFSEVAETADWAVVYYAGHGVEFNGMNYLIPIDAHLKSDRDIALETLELGKILASIEGAKKLRLVILDACRDNPFLSQMRRTAGTRSVSRGLASVEPDAGTLVVYAAKHGETALDGDGHNSPFTQALLNRLQTPNIDVRRLFDVVRDDVMTTTNKRQQPFSYGSLSGSQDFVFLTK